MVLTDVRVDLVSIPLTEPMVTSFGRMENACSAIVRCETADGEVGLGEAAPIVSFLSEGVEFLPLLIRKYIAPVIRGLECYDIERAHRAMDRRVKGNHFAKGAIDIAMYDLMGKRTGQPVANLIGGRLRDRIPLIWSVPSCDLESTVRHCRSALETGIGTMMIKCGALEPALDIDRVRAVRERCGPDVQLIIDANGGWTPLTAIQTIRKMVDAGCDLLFVEQPVPHWDFEGFARVQQAVTVPLSADESLSTPTTAYRLTRTNAAHIFSIKLAKHGGILHSKTISMLAAATGRRCFINSMIETDLSVASSTQFAASCPTLVDAGQALMSELRLRQPVLRTRLKYDHGAIIVPKRPGLGVDLDERVLEQYAMDTELENPAEASAGE